MHSTCKLAVSLHMLHCIDLVVIGLLYMAYPNGYQHTMFIPAKAKALPHEWALAHVCCTPSLV